MAFSNEIDPTQPEDTEDASEGAGRIREFKLGIIERLLTMFRNFPDEDPAYVGEAILVPVAGAEVGNEADRPATPDRMGHIWLSEDEERVFVGKIDLSWLEVTQADPTPAPLSRVKMGRAATQSGVAEGVVTPISWDNDYILWEVGEWFDEGVSVTNLVVPETGLYHLLGQVLWGVPSSGTLTEALSFLYVNSDEVARVSAVDMTAAAGPCQQVAMYSELVAGDIITLRVQHVNSISGGMSVLAGTYLMATLVERP